MLTSTRTVRVVVSIAMGFYCAFAQDGRRRAETFSLPEREAASPTQSKLSASVRQKAAEGKNFPVTLLLTEQADIAEVETIRASWRMRIDPAEERYRTLLDRSLFLQADPYSVREAKEQVERSMIGMRQEIAQRLTERFAPQQIRVTAWLASLGASNIQRFWLGNVVTADIQPDMVYAIEQNPDVARAFAIEPLRAYLSTSTLILGGPAFWDLGFAGEGQSIAVIDTGINETHPAFAGKQVIARTFLENGRNNPCLSDDVTSTRDRAGHGTHVAGIAGGQGSAKFPDSLGVARGLSGIYALKAGVNTRTDTPDCENVGGFDGRDYLGALLWAVTETPVRVFNMSLGGPRPDDDLIDLFVDALADLGSATLVVAAGNDGPLGRVGSPGNAFNVISVANLDTHRTVDRDDDEIHWSSSRGPTSTGRFKPDVAAPGTEISSADARSDGFIAGTGTSMAAPHIAGAAALLYQSGITDPLAVKAVLLNSTDQAGWRPDRGWGYANLWRAVRWRSYHFEGSVPVGVNAQRYRFWRGRSAGELSATLVWNRHVDPEPLSAALRDLRLSLYASEDGSTLARSELPRQNVQQILHESTRDVVMKVSVPNPSAASPQTENFALALSQSGFSARTGPRLTSTCDTPPTAQSRATVTLTCRITNNGDLPAMPPQAQMRVGGSATSAAIERALVIDAGRTVTASVRFVAPQANGSYGVTVTFSSLSFGETFAAAADTSLNVTAAATLPLLQPASDGLTFDFSPTDPRTKSQILIFRSSQGNVRFTVTNQGAAWLTPVSRTATTPADIEVGVNAAGLSPGTHIARLRVTSAETRNPSFDVPVTVTVAAPAVSLRILDSRTARSIPESGCGAPTGVSNFTVRDTRAIFWIVAEGARAGDRPTFAWYTPGGLLHRTTEQQPIPSPGTWCMSNSIDIAGTSASALLGQWSVRAFWNGAQVAEAFFVISTVGLDLAVLSAEAPPPQCRVPTPTASFRTSTSTGYVWFLVNEARAGDVATVAWYSPNGALYSSRDLPPIPSAGNWCNWEGLTIAGAAPGATPGKWIVRVFWNRSYLFGYQFDIVSSGAGAAITGSGDSRSGADVNPSGRWKQQIE